MGFSQFSPQFIEGQFKEDSAHTIGVEFGSKIVPVGGKTVKLQIWDTAGQVSKSKIYFFLKNIFFSGKVPKCNEKLLQRGRWSFAGLWHCFQVSKLSEMSAVENVVWFNFESNSGRRSIVWPTGWPTPEPWPALPLSSWWLATRLIWRRSGRSPSLRPAGLLQKLFTLLKSLSNYFS